MDGTFCQYVVQVVDQVVPIPDELPNAEATAIMCAVSAPQPADCIELIRYAPKGLTVYAALRQCEAHVGQWIAIPGAGGGLGHLGQDTLLPV